MRTASKNFDLTSSPGLSEAVDFMKNQDGYLLLFGPIPYLVKKAADHLASQPPTAREQQEIAVSLLQKGREMGLSEIEIELGSNVGFDIGGKLPKELNIDVKLKAGAETKTIVRAKYRDV